MLDPYDVPWPSWRQFRAILGLLQLLLGFYDAVCNVFVFDSWLVASLSSHAAWQPLPLRGPLLLLGTDSPTRSRSGGGGGGSSSSFGAAWLLSKVRSLAPLASTSLSSLECLLGHSKSEGGIFCVIRSIHNIAEQSTKSASTLAYFSQAALLGSLFKVLGGKLREKNAVQ